MKCTIYASDLKKIVNGTKKFVEKNSSNEQMNWIHITVNAETKEVMAEATDGHRISREYCRIVKCDESFAFYIKAKIPSTVRQMYAELELSGNKALVSCGENIIGYIQPQTGDYFKTNDIFEDARKHEKKATICVDCKYMAEALMSISDPVRTRSIEKIEITGTDTPILITPIVSDCKDKKLVLPVRYSVLEDAEE